MKLKGIQKLQWDDGQEQREGADMLGLGYLVDAGRAV